jgi:predicted RNA-binding Zn-ribbon protein involved in translation (DUF1610 family)
MPQRVHFNCPHCDALYHVVRIEAGPETADRQATCRACGAPLPVREGKVVFKYFLLRERAGFDPRARKGQRTNPRKGHQIA